MPRTTPSTRCFIRGAVERAEAQRVERGDRPRAHREDVAQDAADAGRRALVRLDERRMIVRLHLEGDGEAVADVHDARVLARPLQDARPGRREASSGGRATTCRSSARSTSRRRSRARRGSARGRGSSGCARTPRARGCAPGPSSSVIMRGPGWISGPPAPTTTDSNILRPASLPSRPSAQRSGCGIRPTTLPAGVADARDPVSRRRSGSRRR